MTSPLISIITVCYNAQEVIEPTLESIKNQTFKKFEYIVVDGASKDLTLKILENSGVEISNFLSESDKGIYDAMNKGIAMARGKYLMFLNAGDSLYSEDTLKIIAETAKTEDPDIIYGDTAIVDANRIYLRPRHHRPPKKLTYESFKNGMLVCHQAFLPKRELVPMYNLKYRFSSDFDWCIKILSKARKNVQIKGFMVNYLYEGTTTRNRFKSLCERFKIMAHHYGLTTTILKHIWFLYR